MESDAQTLLALHCLKGILRVQYRTLRLEFHLTDIASANLFERNFTLSQKMIKINAFEAGPKATQVISIGLGRTMERKRNSEHLKKTAPKAEVLLK
ncbi:hypothetical protein MTR_0001s0510 [Medicago truncatula]|uniref:Uncharacterized protein n=1 Tax=Medicago truncatula TaxID=3880 RepID=A0A072TK03_MEDTR|nr:hypothetical protein MTR_0001s0510 [Medicago truncatula]